MSHTPPVKILFEDKHVLIVAKPARVLTASDKTGDETLLSMLRAFHLSRQEDGKKGYLVPLHFLDRPVSGVVMFAVSSKAASRMSMQFRQGKVEKIYHALVEAVPSPKAGELADYLLKNKESNIVTVVPPGTKDAKSCSLSYRTLEKTAGNEKTTLCLLEVRPHTGRSHQIRVQLSSRRWPIYGDVKYGASTGFDGAIALHAHTVKFDHPVTKERIEVSTPVPESWRKIWLY